MSESSASPEHQRTRVKICGITTEDDGRAAIAAGADALGFNTFSGSKRYLDLSQAGDWIGGLPTFVCRVAVMVNPTLDEALEVAGLPYIDVVQFHGDESLEFCAEFAGSGLPFIKAVAVGNASDLDCLGSFHTASVLLDASVPGQYGGTGMVIDWQLARDAVLRYPGNAIILSGGLHSDNVREAVQKVAPYGVDVASGVECSPGRKDRAMVRDFVRNAT